MVKVEVDRELYRIIRFMQRDPMVDRAIRSYAESFIGPLPSWDEKYEKGYRGKSRAKANKGKSSLKPKRRKKKTTEDWSKSYEKEWS